MFLQKLRVVPYLGKSQEYPRETHWSSTENLRQCRKLADIGFSIG